MSAPRAERQPLVTDADMVNHLTVSVGQGGHGIEVHHLPAALETLRNLHAQDHARNQGMIRHYHHGPDLYPSAGAGQ